jgi:hypothetical protein
MKKNMGTTDRAIRVLVAFAVAILYLTGPDQRNARPCPGSLRRGLRRDELRRVVPALHPARLLEPQTVNTFA